MNCKTACLIVPMFNEAHRLVPHELVAGIERSAEYGIDLHLLLVNDGSVDDTASVARSAVALMPDNVDFLDLPVNVGKAEAVRRGLNHAIRRFEFVGYWDADLATPLDELPAMLELLVADANLVMVLGSRVRLLGRHIERSPVRHILGRVFATAASMVLDLPVYDTQCGAKVLRRCPAVEDALNQPFRSRWAFDVEFMARIMLHVGEGRKNTVFVEHSLSRWVDVPGSKVKPSDLPRSLWDLLRVYQRSHPGANRAGAIHTTTRHTNPDRRPPSISAATDSQKQR